MTILYVFLLLIGTALLIGSFFITEKLTPSEMQKMAELSDQEIKSILDKRLTDADSRIESTIDDAVDESLDKVERKLDRETNEKIMAIHEYSDTVMDEMNKTRNEITFLYSMLNDRHGEMVGMAGDLKDLIHKADDTKKEMNALEKYGQQEMEEKEAAEKSPEPKSPVPEEKESAPPEEEAAEELPPEGNHNERILELAAEGKSAVEIARLLSLGVGEVQLVMSLTAYGKGKE